jgi:hypothetical protein
LFGALQARLEFLGLRHDLIIAVAAGGPK